MLRRLQLLGLLILIVVVGIWFVIARAGDDQPDEVEIEFDGRVPDGTNQVLLVVGDPTTLSAATVTLYRRADASSAWTVQKGPYAARVGANGFRPQEQRTEGDGTTPEGVFALTGAFGRDGAPGGTRLPYTKLAPTDCWISNTTDPAYNRWVTRDECTAPDENLYVKSEQDMLFHSALILDFNVSPATKGRGSAIFVHASARDTNGEVTATSGGVGVGEKQLRAIISAIDPRLNPVAVIGRESWVGGVSA